MKPKKQFTEDSIIIAAWFALLAIGFAVMALIQQEWLCIGVSIICCLLIIAALFTENRKSK